MAYRIHLPYEIGKKSVGEEYDERKGMVICDIFEGECPYSFEGKIVWYGDSETGNVCICISNGLVEKLGDSTNVIPFKKRLK